MTNDIKLAQRVINQYANDLEGLTEQDCRRMGIEKEKCRALREALGPTAGGVITAKEVTDLNDAGFSPDFVHALAGDDGLKALLHRVAWLNSYAVKKNFFGKSAKVRGVIIQELGEIGTPARSAVPKLIEDRKDKDGHVRVAAVVALGKLADAGADPDEAARIVSALFSGSLIWSPNMVPAICDSLFLIAQTMGPQEVQNSIVPQLDKDLRRNESWL
ncbi:MAG: HEAT repeat domain-containing protein, partial [Deltaproteobacteria bacterium]|nr:HEAT repeat domain-containing protein [Deltaproteobacteria bacterium]